MSPAAFRRLRVETYMCMVCLWRIGQPPLGGCVLKLSARANGRLSGAAAFRRLRVETF